MFRLLRSFESGAATKAVRKVFLSFMNSKLSWILVVRYLKLSLDRAFLILLVRLMVNRVKLNNEFIFGGEEEKYLFLKIFLLFFGMNLFHCDKNSVEYMIRVVHGFSFRMKKAS